MVLLSSRETLPFASGRRDKEQDKRDPLRRVKVGRIRKTGLVNGVELTPMSF